MKRSLLTTLSFLLLLFSMKLLFTRLASPEPVYDINGDVLKSSLSNYVVSFIWGGGGVLNLGRGTNDLCPFEVYQERSDLQQGTKIKFSPYDNSTIIRASTDLNVKFVYRNAICREISPPMWKVSNYNASRGKWFIAASGFFEEGNPGA